MPIETFDPDSENWKRDIQSPASITSSISTLMIGIAIAYYGFKSIRQPTGSIIGSLPLLLSIIIVIYSQLYPVEFFAWTSIITIYTAFIPMEIISIPIIIILILSLSSVFMVIF